jgi:hypothetical protein
MKKMKVVVLQGEMNVGKSCTMWILYDLMLQNGFVEELPNPIPASGDDFSAILIKDGVRIGFMTFGDVLKDQGGNLKKLMNEHHCALTLCASRLFTSWHIHDHYEGGPPIPKEVVDIGSLKLYERALKMHEANTRDAIRMLVKALWLFKP